MSTNIPTTVWSPTDGNSEATNPGVKFIVDTTAAFLVDTTGAFVVDTGTDFKLIPATVWAENDAL